MSQKAETAVREAMVPMGSMQIHPDAQRTLNQARVDHLRVDFDPSSIGSPVVCHKDGVYYVIDGQHRLAAYKEEIGDGWERKHIKCRIYDNLTKREMAELFLRLNNTLSVTHFDKYEKGVIAGRENEVAVDKIVKGCGLVVREGVNNGSISCTGTLMRMYVKVGGKALKSAITSANSAFGDAGLGADIIEALSLVFHRYEKRLAESTVIDKLSTLKGGVGALRTAANNVQAKLKKRKGQSTAAAIVDVLNKGAGSGAKRLPDWFSVE